MPPRLRACPVRSIASGFFAHLSLVIDGLIRCDDDGALPVVRISDDNTKQPNFYLDRRGDDLYGYFFATCTRAALQNLPAWVPKLARPPPPPPIGAARARRDGDAARKNSPSTCSLDAAAEEFGAAPRLQLDHRRNGL